VSVRAFDQMRAVMRAVLRRGHTEREMHEEMAAHMAQATERLMARGMSKQDALLAARREFGPVGVLQERARDARGGRWIETLVGDLRHAFRYFALTLALGIGFSSAGFSVLNGILTRPAPGVPNDPALVKIRGFSSVRPFERKVSYPELAAYAALTETFASVAAWVTADVVIDVGDADFGVISAKAQFVTSNYFATLGVRLAAGRGFTQSRFDQLSPPEYTAIVSDAFASERLGGVSSAVGKQVRINDMAVTIIGVTQPRFRGAVQSADERVLWLPLSAWQPVTNVSREVFTNPNAGAFDAMARLRPGVSVAHALPAVLLVAARADADAQARAAHTFTATADVVRLRGLIKGHYGSDLGVSIAVVSAIAILILLVCTTTVNSLLIGAAVTRRYEIGVRLALGASRWRVVRQLLTEIAVLAIAGGILGMYAFGSVSRLIEVAQDGFDVSPDWVSTTFTLLYALLTATLCGLSPALHATRAGLSEVLKDSAANTTGRSRLQRAFVVAQIAIAQPLMVGLAAAMASLMTDIKPLNHAALRERLLTANFDTYAGHNARGPDRIPELVRQIASLPGVIAVLPQANWDDAFTLEPPASPSADGRQAVSVPVRAEVTYVSPGFFAAVDAPIVLGRDFVASDTNLAVMPIILSEPLATRLFSSGSPIGKRLHVSVPVMPTVTSAERILFAPPNERRVDMEVVGVARAGYGEGFRLFESDLPLAFAPFKRAREGALLVRTDGPAEPLIPRVQAIARQEAPSLPVRMRTLAQHDRERRSLLIKIAGAGAGTGMIALMLASVGLYAMLSVAVGQRRREIGVRVALGARTGQVVRMFFVSGLRATLLGLTLGLPLSSVTLWLLMNELEEPSRNMPIVAAVVALAVLSVASLASWVPARRAASVDPMLTLRAE
jgi:predicted permease